MRILAVGNSFSQDATTFLHQTAANQGIDLTVVNLYMGGCSLETHWKNLETGACAYEYQLNGTPVDRLVSLNDTLRDGNWDAIITQQASHDSGWLDTYEPFLSHLVEAFHRASPNARLMLQETWAYEIGSQHEAFPRYHRDQLEMFERLQSNYYAMARKHHMELIPCGDIVQKARSLPPFHVQTGGRSLCRDGFHMSFGYGRYMLACAWARALCGIDTVRNTYVPVSEEEVSPELLDMIRKTVDEVIVKESLFAQAALAGF